MHCPVCGAASASFDPRGLCPTCAPALDVAEIVRLDALGEAMGCTRAAVNADTLAAAGAAVGLPWHDVTVEAIAADPKGVRQAVFDALAR